MKAQTYTSPTETVAALKTLYATEAGRLRDQFAAFANGEAMPGPAPRWRGRPWKHWFAHRRHGAEALEVAIAALPAGTQTLRYRIRAATPGRYRVLPALLWEAYRPDVRANGAGFEIEVVE